MWNLKVGLLLLAVSHIFAVALGATLPDTAAGGRIVGGIDAAPNQIPYIASLRYRPSGNHFCGSSIIGPRWVLSAAHCTDGVEPEQIIVVVGAVLLSSGGVAHDARLVLNHPEYTEELLTADISLVQVHDAFSFNDAVQMIGVGTEYIYEASAVVSGWGLTNHTYSQLPDNLQTLPTRIITNEACREGHPVWHEFVYDTVICTFTQVGQGICFGDSGGSLVVGNYIVGIPSWVEPCGVGYPDAYARVSSHHEWIFENMQNNE